MVCGLRCHVRMAKRLPMLPPGASAEALAVTIALLQPFVLLLLCPTPSPHSNRPHGTACPHVFSCYMHKTGQTEQHTMYCDAAISREYRNTPLPFPGQVLPPPESRSQRFRSRWDEAPTNQRVSPPAARPKTRPSPFPRASSHSACLPQPRAPCCRNAHPLSCGPAMSALAPNSRLT